LTRFETKRLPGARDAVAPDGSDVRMLLGLSAGGLAHFELGAGETSIPVAHRTVEEIWYFIAGRGEMWRRLGDHEEVVEVEAGICITIPPGTHFQIRSFEGQPLAALGVTMPPWPGEGEAYRVRGNADWRTTIDCES
jgi:mannose-6-phosphate isomerase-like protein (cupin superfamily)